MQARITHHFREPHEWEVEPDQPYAHLDVVALEGGSYIHRKLEPTNTHPEERDDWSPYVARGEQGEMGLLSPVVIKPIIDGPSSIELGEVITFTASGSQSVYPEAIISQYEWRVGSAVYFGATLDIDTSDSRPGYFTILCRAIDTLLNPSDWAYKTVSVTVSNNAPSMSGFTHNLPATLTPNGVYTVALSGATDTDNDPVTYSLRNVSGGVFAAIDDITGSVALTVGNLATTLEFDVFAQDNRGGVSAAIRVTAAVAQPPVMTNAVCTLPAGRLEGGVSYDFTITGITDPNGLGYTLTAANVVNATIDALGDNQFRLTTNNTNLSLSFDMVASTALGAVSAPFDVVKVVNQGPVGAAIITSTPSVINKGTQVTVAVSGATDPNNDALTYQIVDLINCTATPDSVVTEGGAFTLAVSNGSETSFSYGIEAVDTGGKRSVVKTVSGIINQPPVSDTVVSTAPTLFISTTAVNFSVSGGSDPNGGSFTYNLVNAVGITFSKTSGIAANEVIQATATGAEAISYGVSITDGNGLTSSAKAFTASLNLMPVETGMLLNYPASMQRNGSYNLTLSGATDPNNDALTYQIVSANGCTVTAVSAANGFTLTVDPQATAVSIVAKVVDSRGGESGNKTLTFSGTLTYATGDVTTSAGSTQAITINPGFAGTVTVIGNGGGGAAPQNLGAVTANAAQMNFPSTININSGTIDLSIGFYVCCSLSLINVGYSINLNNKTASFNGNVVSAEYNNGSTVRWKKSLNYGDSNGRLYERWIELTASYVKVWNAPHSYTDYDWDTGAPYTTNYGDLNSYGGSDFIYNATVNSTTGGGTAGAASTVSGAISTSFSGATTGVVAAPGAETRYFNLSAGSTHNLSVYAAPSGGSVRVLW